MDSEVTNLSFVKGLTSGISNGNVLVVNANVADDDFLKIDGTSVEGRTVAEVLSDLNVEAGADVTDTTNVEAAGALMDSELTDLAGVKGVTISNLATKTGVETLTNKTLSTPDINTPDIDGGTIDGTTIATSNITVGSGKTLNVSDGTLTLGDNQISGDKVEGGTIASTTITSLTSTNIVTTHLTASNDISSSITSTGSFGFLNVPGDAVIGGKVTAQEFHTEFVSASIIYESGSSQFGDTSDDTHDFIGTMSITGSLTGSFNTSASFGNIFASDNIEAMGTGSFRVLNVVQTIESQGRVTAPGFTSTANNVFLDTTVTGTLTVIGDVNTQGNITGLSLIHI